MFGFITEWFHYILYLYALIHLTIIIVPNIIHSFLPVQDLKAKYNAKWAVVTGASTGIGRAITEKLASQGINVVLVALDDQFLKDFHAEIKKRYPNLEFKAVGVDLSKDFAFDAVVKATEDITVSLLFNNAGFVIAGLFPDVALEKSLANISVNVTCGVKLTHHFLNKMLDNGTKGAIIFTSSPAGLFPNPCTSMYSATKAFLTKFAQSIAGEVKANGIDVLAVHPSPVNTNFYLGENANKVDAMNFFKQFATTPALIADVMFASVGKTVVREQGQTAFWFKLLSQFMDVNIIAWISCYVIPYTADFKKLKKDRKKDK